MRKWGFALFTIILFCELSSNLSASIVQTDTEKEEYVVYSAVISQKYIKKGDEMMVIDDETRVDTFEHDSLKRDAAYVLQKLPPLAQSTMEDYRNKNRNSHPLNRRFDVKVPYTLFGSEDAYKVLKNGGWKTYHESYPNSFGVLLFSRVGFNPGINQALVYVEVHCGSLCGSGNYILLTKEDGAWKIRDELNWFIS